LFFYKRELVHPLPASPPAAVFFEIALPASLHAAAALAVSLLFTIVTNQI
jgi:hypothetical protein